MKLRYKALIVALSLAVVSFFLSRMIWPDMLEAPMPKDSLVPYFMFISALESLSFGLGVAFAIFGWPHLRRINNEHRALSIATFVSIVWLLVSWWPHDNMHRVNGMENFVGLLRIEYIFHFTLIIAGLIVAKYFWKQISRVTLQ